ncbi:MlaD family protein [Zwartia sp.]|uniref:PqiB family protein n=1 Tax=Zwartia sp. TaxID=2978004 RepID=UPI002717BC9B|nr:MlaD family protein [Zwartia sp.]MDO9023289.1 MlaD family protein [Zwartia sp.]
MPEVVDTKALPPPKVARRPKRSLAWVWLIPIIALLVGLSIVWRGISQQGPKITISFQSATGIETGKTQIRYRDVVIGLVKGVRLNGMQDGVIVEAELTKDGAVFAKQGSRFWVVRPRVGLGGVSGLTTLLSGSYIETDFDGTASSRATEKVFIGLEQPPPIASDRPGKHFVLRTNSLGSLGPGAPIYYRRIQVGLVTGFKLNDSGHHVDISAFVDAPYDKFVDGSTRFWNESGVDLTIGSNGMHLQTESLISLIAGGVSFSSFGRPVPLSDSSVPFKLFDSRRAAELVPEGVAVPIRMRFDQTVRGLNVGAAVAFHGVDIGVVDAVALDFDLSNRKFFTNVDATLYPERLGAVYVEMSLANRSQVELAESLRELTTKGLRAQLRTANILTGQLYITLADFPNAPKVADASDTLPLTIPTIVSDDLDKLQAQLTSIVGKIDQIPFEKIALELDDMMKEFRRLSMNLDKTVTPKLASSLAEIEKSAKSLNALIAPGSPMTTSTESMLEDLRRSLKSLRSLTDSLQANPDSVIRGRSTQPYSRDTLGAPGQ